jgi:hypothetical protein
MGYFIIKYLDFEEDKMTQEFLDLLRNLQKMRIERKTTEELIEHLLKEQTPSGYPSSTIQGERVQTSGRTQTAEYVLTRLAQLRFQLEVQRDNLLKLEIDTINQINKDVDDSLEKSFVIKKYILNKQTKEIIKDFGMSKSFFYKTFKNYFGQLTKKT